MSLEQLSSDDIVKLRSFFKEGSQVLGDVESLNEGLKETAKALANELNVKPAELMKALKLHHKQALAEEQDKMSTVETLLATVN